MYIHSQLQIDNTNIRRTTFQGRTHIIAPVVLMTEGIHHGSAGRILYTSEELSRMPQTWHGRPVPIMHPTDNDGSPRSCNDPDILETQSAGRVFNVEWEAGTGRLKGEVWIDEQRAREICNSMNLPDVVNMITSGESVEVSTGLYPERNNPGGVWNGEEYDATAIGIHADHLALLPGGQGACSWQDGCGIRNSEDNGGTMQRTKQPGQHNQEENPKEHPLQANQVGEGYRELLYSVQSKLDGMDNDYRVHFLEELYDNEVIYRVENNETGEANYYRRSYAVNEDGSIEFGAEPEQVRKQVEFVPVQQQQSKQDEQEVDMTKEKDQKQNEGQGCCPKKVEAVINATVNGFTEDDKEKLQAMDEVVLDKIPTEELAPTTNARAAEEQELDLQTILSNTDGELKESIEHGRKLYQQERTNLIKRVTANTSQFTEEELGKMDFAMLEKVANSIKPAVNYSGAGGADLQNQGEEAEEGIGMPWVQGSQPTKEQ